MYKYKDFDQEFIRERNTQFRAQVARRISGALTEDEFKPLRLMNGVYLQLHAYMLRVAIPYGTLNSRQMLTLADIAERWDKGYGHFTTRQNIQFNWPNLSDIPDILDALAAVDMHAIQTSGNTIRNVTADHFAGAAADEVADPRPYAEWIRQWSTDHPEFQFLPRKFKIAVTGSQNDRAVIRAHDIGLQLVEQAGKLGMRVIIGGGLGRTPMIGKVLDDFVPIETLLSYLEAVVSVWNLIGRRDNKYKARIKITVHEHGLNDIRARVIERFSQLQGQYQAAAQTLLEQIKTHFAPPQYRTGTLTAFHHAVNNDPDFKAWVTQNVTPHKQEGYASVTVSLKAHGQAPGDASAAQMRALAELAEQVGLSELRVSHEQNIVLPHVAQADLMVVFDRLKQEGLATANIGLVSDLIACPGMDYCALATARSIPIGQQIARRYQQLESELGPLKIKISGCINACGHHHVGDIGILGLDKAGVENYQITLGGRGGMDAALGEKMGPGFSEPELLLALDRLFEAYLALRRSADEAFGETVKRLGTSPFKSALYEVADAA